MKINKLFSFLVILALLMVALPAASAGAAGIVTVKPTAMNGWAFALETGATGAGNFVSGPDTAPLSGGSAHFTTAASTDGILIGLGAFGGTRFDDITALQYSTYQALTSSSTVQVASLQLNVDNNVADLDFGWKGRLVFEPYYSETVVKGSWQAWDALTQGKWWATGAPMNATCSIASPCTWAQVLAAFPNAGIHSTLGAVAFKAGSSWPAGFDGNVDAFIIGVNDDNTTYDFEPTPPDEQAPVVSNVAVTPNPAPDTTTSFTLSADASDNVTVTSAAYTVDGGSPVAFSFTPGSSVALSATLGPLAAGVYNICVTASDAVPNTSAPECTILAVYDPDGGFVTGGGWITSPEGAMSSFGPVWDQDFAIDDSGWLDDDDVWYGDIAVAGGTATFFGDVDSGPFSRFDGYRSSWPGTWMAEIDVYLDPSWPTGQGFDYSVAATGSDNDHQRDFIFHVGVVEDYGPITGRALLVNGSNNADFTTNPYKLVNDNGGNYYHVTAAGWYTLQHVFRDAGGYLAVDLNLVDSNGNILWTATRENIADTIPGEVGGNRYAWFTHIDVTAGIQVDNHQLFMNIPSPAGKATFGFVSKYRRGATVPDGNTEFQFKAGGLNFSSTSYQWLVVNQNGSNAQFKGYGTINGAGNYGFMLWAGDGSPDTFRIQIWDEGTGDVVYDNGPDQPIGGGSIVVHRR